MPESEERREEESPARSQITPDVVSSFRSQLTSGEDVVDPTTWAGSVPQAHGIGSDPAITLLENVGAFTPQ
jgi:hypothetical protein